VMSPACTPPTHAPPCPRCCRSPASPPPRRGGEKARRWPQQQQQQPPSSRACPPPPLPAPAPPGQAPPPPRSCSPARIIPTVQQPWPCGTSSRDQQQRQPAPLLQQLLHLPPHHL
jgi:hypothetical protein